MKTLALLWLVFSAAAEASTWRYQLIAESGVMEDCIACGRPSFWIPIKGSFDLKSTSDPQRYEVQSIDFVSDLSASPEYRITGSGVLTLANGQPEIILTNVITRPASSKTLTLTNSPPEGSRTFPMLSLRADESPAPGFFVYRLRLFAAPFRELWFSTASSFTSGPNFTAVSDGDLLSNFGRIVKRNSWLTSLLSIPPGDVGLDALDVGPHGEIFFSITTNTVSLLYGTITDGDIVTSRGRLYLKNSQLLAAFSITGSDPGLDAIRIVSDDETYFSIARDAKRANGDILKRGDILSSKGKIIRTEADLFSRFISPITDPIGVDAYYFWPNGEIWFSPETSFNSPSLGAIKSGDILSDQGYVVARNLDLLAPFAPNEDRLEFGLDALTIITDLSDASGEVRFSQTRDPLNGILDLAWDGQARFFQIEEASQVVGPYRPATEIITDPRALFSTDQPSAFFRIRAW